MKKAISIIIVIMFLMTVFSVGRNRVLAENETDPGQNEEVEKIRAAAERTPAAAEKIQAVEERILVAAERMILQSWKKSSFFP